MNNASMFISPLENTQFFSAISSIIILGEILYGEKQIVPNRKNESIQIINDLCKFLEENNDEKDVLLLGRRLIQSTDLYGARENETLSLSFVNAMLNNIIANTVFSKYGNTFGYLALIVNSTNDLKLSSVKRRIVDNLHRQKFQNDYGNVSTLSNMTITRITKKIIFPLFPETNKDMKIIHIKYAYAQAGLTLLRSAQENTDEVKFSALVSLAQRVEQSVLDGKIDQSGLKIFQLPALLYHTHKDGIKRKNLKSFMVSTTFWHRVYNSFFTNLQATSEKIILLQKKNPVYSFQMALSKFKTRTQMANETLLKNCPNESDHESKLISYKNNPEEFYCNLQLQPNVNEMFFEQNRLIARKYYYFEKRLMHQIFDDGLKKFIDQKNVTIKPIKDFWKNNCFRCAILSNRPKLSEGIDLFQTYEAGKAKGIYALIRSRNGMKLLAAGDLSSFLIEIGLNERAKLDVPFAAENMKSPSTDENFNTFVNYIASWRQKKFLQSLKLSGYEATTTEKVGNFFKHLIPFYACAEAVEDPVNMSQTATTCIFDFITLFPFFGLISSASVKITLGTIKSSVLNIAFQMQKFTLTEVIKSVMKIGIRVIALDTIKSFSKIVTREYMKSFAFAIFRSLDPGIEFTYMLTKGGWQTIMKGWRFLKGKTNFLSNVRGASGVKIGSYKGFDVQVESLGKDAFGVKKIVTQDQIVELRKVRGYVEDMPVVVVNQGKRKIYKIIDLDTGRLGAAEWEEKAGILCVADKSLTVRLHIIKTEGLSGRGGIAPGLKRTKVREILEERQITALEKVPTPSERENLKLIMNKYVLENYDNYCGDFVDFWLKFKRAPSWSKCCRLTDTELFNRIRFHPLMEDISLSRADAINSIFNIYGQQYTRDVINIDPEFLYEFYLANELHDSISFRNQYALGNYINSGFTRIHLDDLEALNMRRALYTTALRKYDSGPMLYQNNFNEYLYSTDVKPTNEVFPIEEAKVIDIKEFTILSNEYTNLLPHLKHAHKDLIKVMHKFKLDHHCLTLRLKKYLPFKTEQAVLLPGIQLYLAKWEYQLIDGHYLLVMEWKNVMLNKSKWLADTSNKIKILNDREQDLLNFETIDIEN